MRNKDVTRRLGELQVGNYFHLPVSIERSNIHSLATRVLRHVSVKKQGAEYLVTCLGVYGSKESLYEGKKIRRDSGNVVDSDGESSQAK